MYGCLAKESETVMETMKVSFTIGNLTRWLNTTTIIMAIDFRVIMKD